MESLGFDLRKEASLESMTMEVLKSSEIEGEILNVEQVRSSIARHLGLEIPGQVPSDRNVDGIVDVMMEATQNFEEPLTEDRLFSWHSALFPTGRSGLRKIVTGGWRNDQPGPMQVVSGSPGKETIHFEAPSANRVKEEVSLFIQWFNSNQNIDPVLKAAIAHFWFITIHPFADGNGRLARIISEMQLTRADQISERFYNMSAQIRIERKEYYQILEKCQKGNLDVTDWITWFLNCLDHAITESDRTFTKVLHKARFWESIKTKKLNERQRLMINKLLDGFEGNLNSSKWAKIAKCSQDTALRDIQNLIDQDVLRKEEANGRSTVYVLQEMERRKTP
jgi:Fic family protein